MFSLSTYGFACFFPCESHVIPMDIYIYIHNYIQNTCICASRFGLVEFSSGPPGLGGGAHTNKNEAQIDLKDTCSVTLWAHITETDTRNPNLATASRNLCRQLFKPVKNLTIVSISIKMTSTSY